MTERALATKTAMAPAPAKAIGPQNLFEQFNRIYDSIGRRAFEIFDGNGRVLGRDLDNWFQAEFELLHPVKINMTETDGGLTVQAEVPGFTNKDLEIRMEPRRLTISGERETGEEHKKGKTIYEEHRSNEILRVVDLPAAVDTENVTATLRNGLLELQISKSAKSSKTKATRIEVKSA
jgi:HSP20 family protein